jgi:hypothetical protein
VALPVENMEYLVGCLVVLSVALSVYHNTLVKWKGKNSWVPIITVDMFVCCRNRVSEPGWPV